VSSYELALKARISSSLEVEDLEKRARTEARRLDRPRALTFKNIHVADKVFQWRMHSEVAGKTQGLNCGRAEFVEP
jgi:hypothetical protein